MACAPGFHDTIAPALSAEMIASCADSAIARKRSSLARSAVSASSRSPIWRFSSSLLRRRFEAEARSRANWPTR